VTVIGNLADRATGQLFAPAATRLQLGRADVVIAGITTDILAQYRAPVRPTLDLAAPATWAKEKFPELLTRAPVKIVLSHAGLRLDRGIFPFVPDGTLIAGAHDHAQFVERMGRTVYFHSGSWNSHLSIVRLTLEPDGPSWAVEQVVIRDSDPTDPELAALVHDAETEHLMAEDVQSVGRNLTELSRTEAAGHVVRQVRRVAGVDAAFIGNTTFGDGLPAGEVSRFALDACVRFDGTIWVAEITGARLRRLMRGANQGPDTPFVERQGEFQFADGPAEIVGAQQYRIATNDWGVRNRERYFGAEEITFSEKPELRLKAIVSAALAAGDLTEK
jgi:2',3'-cyclic-nucleotide 2'-phosphodiesterase (5'-nucleotidase family)